MASLMNLPMSFFVRDNDAQLVAGDVGAGLEFTQSSRMWWAFDDTDEEAIISGSFIMPTQYTGSGLKAVIKGFFKTEAVAAETATIDIFVEAITASDALDVESAASWDAANPGDVVPDTTQGDLVTLDITLTNADSVAVGDQVRIGVRRDIDDADDTATADFCLTGFELQDDG